jgi:4,5-DOPA dioxygenase extradiol
MIDLKSQISRRAWVKGAGALLVAGAVPGIGRVEAQAPAVMPSVFVRHGGPDMIVDEDYSAGLRRWGENLPRPRGIIVVTPHVRSEGVEIGQVGEAYALYSFPGRFKAIVAPRDYVPPDNTDLAGEVGTLLGARYKVKRGVYRGVNHTGWMPLFHMFPTADIPMLELPMPLMSDPDLFAFGQTLGALRRHGILIMASGTLTHNLATMGADSSGPPASWAKDFDAWYVDAAQARDVQRLINWRDAPAARLAHPDDGGHYRVGLIALGASVGDSTASAPATFPISGFKGAFSSTRSTQFG